MRLGRPVHFDHPGKNNCLADGTPNPTPPIRGAEIMPDVSGTGGACKAGGFPPHDPFDAASTPLMSEPTAPYVICPICATQARYDFSGRDIMFGLYDRYDYFRCTACAAVFMHPMPDMARIASFYPSSYSIFDEGTRVRRLSGVKQAVLKHARGYAHLSPPRMLDALGPLLARFRPMHTPRYVPGGLMLDVGCGNGRYLSTMRTLGWRVQGVELSENGVEVCRAADLSVHHGDLASAHFADDSFDLVTARHVIEHVPDPQSFVAELARILKPSGQLVIETPNANALGRALMSATWFANDVPRHLVLFTPKSIGALAARHGLKKLDIRLETTPKIILNSLDWALANTGKRSSHHRGKRLLARIYVIAAHRTKRGDTLHAIFTK